MTAGLSRAIAELSDLADSSPQRCLRRLVELVAQVVPGCAGAATTAWRDGELAFTAASHPDLAVLLDWQLARGTGPVPDALARETPADVTDTLADVTDTLADLNAGTSRWPDYAAEELRLGVRSSSTLVERYGGLVVTLTLYGAKPRALGAAAAPLAALLAAIGGISLVNTAQYDTSRRTASQLSEAAAARGVVDQAKGLMMNALGCDADEALTRLRQLSQTRHVKVTEIARQLIEEHATLARNRAPGRR